MASPVPVDESCVALFDHHRGEEPGSSRLFFDLHADYQANTCREAHALLAQISDWQAAGLFVVILAAYELGFCFLPEKAAVDRSALKSPLLQLMVFKQHSILSSVEVEDWLAERRKNDVADSPVLSEFCFDQTETEYRKGVEQLLHHLKQGDTYQVNYTLRAFASFEGSALALYQRLRNNQRVAYGVFIQHPDRTILSLSPELFVKKEGSHLWSKPMKGTMARGVCGEADIQQAQFLKHDEKNRAENLIIVDLIRNDLSQLAELHSVNVTDLFSTERYETLWQMTSTVHATVNPALSVSTVLQALFPCGSITGAPKMRTMELIHAYEKTPRGLYTGSIGYLLPNQDFCLNVAIRTLILDVHQCELSFGVGGGITIASDPAAEYQECLLKAAFVNKITRVFDLYESLVLNEGEIRNMARHLQRLSSSAAYFGFEYDEARCRKSLLALEQANPHGFLKAKLVLKRDGSVLAYAEPLKFTQCDPIVFLSLVSTHTTDLLLYHKTTLRDHYDLPFQRIHQKTNCMDIIFQNERGEITEGSYNSIVVLKGGVYYTPPVSCGLLPGLGREEMMKSPEYQLQEKVLKPIDLQEADALYLVNSIRGLRSVQLKSLPVFQQDTCDAAVN